MGQLILSGIVDWLFDINFIREICDESRENISFAQRVTVEQVFKYPAIQG